MGRVKLLLKLAVAGLAYVLYVWFAAVRLAPRVKRRKARRRVRSSQGSNSTVI